VDGGIVRRCAAVLAVLAASTAPATAATATTVRSAGASAATDPNLPDPLTPAQHAAALAEPAIVIVEVHWRGLVRDRATGELLDPQPVSGDTQCTGVGVGSQGYLLTTRSCLRPAAVGLRAFDQLVQRRVADGRTTRDQADDLLAHLLTTATIGYDGTDDPPERTVLVRRAVTDDAPMPATVVATSTEGDATLLKIMRSSQPILPLADGASLHDELVVVECPPYAGTVAATTPSAAAGEEAGPVRPGFRTGVVIETKPHILVDPLEPQHPGATLPGGVVLTHDAALLGLVDASLGGRDELVDATVIRDLLDRAKVNTDLGQVDRDFRAGVDAYYAGRYTESIERFDSVLAIIPSHVQAHKYRDEAQTRRAQQGGSAQQVPGVMHQFDVFVNAWSGSIIGLGVLVAILVFLLHRRRPPHGLPEAPVSPPTVRSPAPEPREPDQTNA
jgi:hypothetical protein